MNTRSLGEHFEQYLRDAVDSGRYTSVEEVLRDALRLHEGVKRIQDAQAAKLEALRADIQVGLDQIERAEVVETSAAAILAELRHQSTSMS